MPPESPTSTSTFTLPTRTCTRTLTLPTLPPEILLTILTHLPPLDYLPLKLTGNHHLTAIIRSHTSHLPRPQYLHALCAEDARRRGLPRYRPAMQIMTERGQTGLVRWVLKRDEWVSVNLWRGWEGGVGWDWWRDNRGRRVSGALYWGLREGRGEVVGLVLEKGGWGVGGVRKGEEEKGDEERGEEREDEEEEEGEEEKTKKLFINVNHLKVGKQPFQKTPMHVAAFYGHVAVAEMLLSYGATAQDLRVNDGCVPYTPLEVALMHDHEDVVALLRGGRGQEAGFNDLVHCPLENWVGTMPGEFGPRHVICDKQEKKIRPSPHLPCIDLLRRLRVELEDNFSVSAEAFRFVLPAWSDWGHLHCLMTTAIKYDSPGLAQVVLEDGYTSYKKAQHPCPDEQIFQMALTYQSEDVIKFFLSHDLMRTDGSFRGAVKMRNKEIIRHFLTSGFPVGVGRWRNNGQTVIHLTAIRNDLPTLMFILENAKLVRRQRKFNNYWLEPWDMGPPEPPDHIDVSMEDYYGRTPLHYAVEHGGVEMVKLLLEHGCFINQRDLDVNSPLDRVGKDKEELIRFLVERGAISTRKVPTTKWLSIFKQAQRMFSRDSYVEKLKMGMVC
ncbi:hypothetical protein FQN50_001967 [Emmonsiellopsis sp. PD_5]|nr:hypothetical protein FQN50_001967 [Emmonsiellopsis sp. PD_5]